MFRFIPMLAGISLILFSTACVANADSAETDISGNPGTTDFLIGDLPATPEGTVARLLQLAEADEWEAYVDDYYGEAYKFNDDGDRTSLVTKFREDWSDQVIDALRKAKDVPPQVSSDGLVAVFEMEGGTFTLYNDGIGGWKFHL